MKKTIAILGISTLTLIGSIVPRAHAGVSVHIGAGFGFAPPICAPAPVVAVAPMAPVAPVYLAVPAPPPVVVYAPPPPVRVVVPAPVPVVICPPRVVLPLPVPSFHVRVPFVDIGFNAGHHHHGRRCR